MAWAAIIAAGGSETGAFADAMGTPHKALAPIAGKTSLSYTLAALGQTQCEQVVVVGPDAVGAVCADVGFVPEGSTAIENIALGMASVPHLDQFLFLPADSPALVGEDLERFMRSFEHGAAVSVTPRATFESTYPGVPVKAIRLAEGEVLSGAPFACDRDSFLAAQAELNTFRERRKSPLSMVFRFGIGNLFRYATGRLRKADAERIVADFLAIPRAWIDLDGHPSLALDFDTLDEYNQVQQIMSSHATN